MDATPQPKYNMLIIDPQNDFHEGGSLAVPGATDDSARIAEFITNSSDKINKIFVSLDTHTPNHIGHPGYWIKVDENGNPVTYEDGKPVRPLDWTFFSVNNEDKIEGRDAPLVAGNGSLLGTYTPTKKPKEPDEKYQARVAFTTKYIEQMQSPNNLKGQALIWPTHCLEVSEANPDGNGHKVEQKLKDALKTFPNVEYHIKGQNELVEMYSIFQAEIPMEGEFGVVTQNNMNLYYTGGKPFKTSSKIDVPNSDVEDGAYLQTSFNEALFESLTSEGKPIVICGEALSHCVNWSLRDLVSHLLELKDAKYVKDDKLIPGQVTLFKNCSSPVTGFKENVYALNQFCVKTGVTIKYVLDGKIVVTNAGGTRKRRRRKNRRTTSKPKRSKKTHNRKPRHRRRTRK